MARIAYVDWDKLVYYDSKIKEYIGQINRSHITMGGMVSFDNLPSPSSENENAIYKVTNDFTVAPNDPHFAEDYEGHNYPANTILICGDYEGDNTYRYYVLTEPSIGGSIDLEGYATEEYVANEIAKIEIPSIEGLATKEELEAVQNVVGQNSVKLFQIDSDLVDINNRIDNLNIPSIDGLATEEYVNEKIAEIEHPAVDLNGYATEEWVNNQGYIKEHQDISHLALKSEIPTKVSDLENDAKYITASEIPPTDLSNYYNKSETEALVNEAVEGLEGITLTDVAEAGFIKSDALEGYAKSEDIPSLDDYAKKSDIPTDYLTVIPDEYITSDELAAEGFLKEHQDLSAYALKSDIPTDYLKEIPSEYVTETELDSKGYLTQHQSLENYATKELVQESIKNVEEKIPSLNGYATEQWVGEQNYLTSVPDEYAKKSDLEGYSKFSGSYNDLTDKPTIPTVPNNLSEFNNDAGFITADAIADKADRSELFSKDYNDLTNKPEIPSIEGLATNESLANKADNILFTEDYRVTIPCGNFTANTSVKDLDLKEILTKILGLTLYVPPSTDLPEGTTPVVENIILNKTPAYYLGNSGSPIVSEFEYQTMTVAEGAQNNQNTSFMYQIVDENGTAVESGYQIVTEELDEGYLTVYIPETVTNFSIRIFDGIGGSWVTPEWDMIENSTYHLDGYKVYTADPNYDIYERMTIRVIIEN